MSRHENPRIALGLITRDFKCSGPIIAFLENASRHGHVVDRVIVSYSHDKDDSVAADVAERVPLDLLRASGSRRLQEQMDRVGVPPSSVHDLLEVPDGGRGGEIPYGAYRNAVLIRALLEEIDYLLFFDTDVEPRVLTELEGGTPTWQEVDFVGRHMDSLARKEVSATTSEYSGYYIIPPLSFPGLGELLNGLGKGMAMEYMADCREHQCLNLGPASAGVPRLTDKPLGGNLGLSLRQAWQLGPFFSTTYKFGGVTVKGRGEDTLLGQSISASEALIMDVDLRVFHNTYAGFPHVPDVRKQSIRDRFYWACLGWIGRNPFLSWYLDQVGKLETDWRSEILLQRVGLEVGGEKAAEHLGDPRFAELADALEASLAGLPDAIRRYRRLIEGWQALLGAIGRGHPPSEQDEDDLGHLPLAS